MKIIATDLVTAVTPTSEDANYPATNVQDNFRTNPWKADSAGADQLVVDVAAGSNAVMLSYMNSPTVTVTVKDAGLNIIYGPTGHTIDSDNPNLWVNYTLQGDVAEITLAFADPSAVPYCGIVRAGYAYDFNTFGYGLSEGLKDGSISKEYNNNAVYYHLIANSIVRTFGGSFLVQRDSDFYTFMHTILRTYGRGPYAMFLTDLTNYDWAVFGWLSTSLASGTHDYYQHSKISIDIEEGI